MAGAMGETRMTHFQWGFGLWGFQLRMAGFLPESVQADLRLLRNGSSFSGSGRKFSLKKNFVDGCWGSGSKIGAMRDHFRCAGGCSQIKTVRQAGNHHEGLHPRYRSPLPALAWQRHRMERRRAVLGIVSPLQAWAADDSQVEEVVVTAQRRVQSIMDVPLSVASYSPQQLGPAGYPRDRRPLAPHAEPAVLRTSGVSGNNSSDISIRGIASDVGSATTAIYIAPTRRSRFAASGTSAATPIRVVFDLERIEVLRGPQGTLFGAGAEGGAVRFLTPTAGLREFQPLQAAAEVANIRNGGTTL